VLNATFRRLQNRERELEAILHGHNNNDKEGRNENIEGSTRKKNQGADATTSTAGINVGSSRSSSRSSSRDSTKRRIEVAWATSTTLKGTQTTGPCSGKKDLPWDQRRLCAATLLAATRAVSLANYFLGHYISTDSKSTSLDSSSSSSNSMRRSGHNIFKEEFIREDNDEDEDRDQDEDWPGEGNRSGDMVAMLDVETWEAVSTKGLLLQWLKIIL
jgi:hypothetical protein